MDELSEVEKRIVTEEEGLFRRVAERLAASTSSSPTFVDDSRQRLLELRDEAATAHEEDLAPLFEQLHTVRAVANRRRVGPLPERACPYFAHLRLRDQKGTRDYLLGNATFLDEKSGLRIIDWRHAPISQIFYRYQEGESFEEELPGRVAEGVVEARRIIVITDGRLRSIVTPDGELSRDPSGQWGHREHTRALGGGAGTAERGTLGIGVGRGTAAAPAIAALLDPIQFDILTRHGADPLLLIGIAGSGKTTVALHRLAALNYEEPARFAPRRMEVVVPEPGIGRLAVRLLAPLGLGETRVRTFAEWARRELFRLLPDVPRRVAEETPSVVSRLKRHPALLEALPGWLAQRAADKLGNLESVRRELLTDRAFLQEVVARSGGELSASAVTETVERTMRQAAGSTEAAYRGTDAERLRTLDGGSLDAGTPEELSRSLDEEDHALLLELWRLSGGTGLPKRAHLVLDEAQELASIELRALRQALEKQPSFTVAGDDMQQTSGPGFSGWDRVVAELGAPMASRRELVVGYRCPLPIATVAEQILGPLSRVAPSGRAGVPVGWYRFAHEGAASLFVQDAIADLLAREPQASLALLTRTAEGAERWFYDLRHVPEVRLVRNGEFSFTPGVDVCEVSEAKGLEFDYIIIPDGNTVTYPANDEARRLLYVAATRAMHQLWICSVGTPSALLPWPSAAAE